MNAAKWVLSREMFLDEEEVALLRKHLVHERERAITQSQEREAMTNELLVNSLIFSGLRNSEFCRLRLSETVLGTGESSFRVRERRGGIRTVFVPDFVSEMIRHYAMAFRSWRISQEIDPDDLSCELLLNSRGRPYERTGLYRRIVKILTAAGFGDRASVQFLRHTYGFLGYQRSGGNLLFLQKQMGHVHPMVTSVYAEFVDEDYGQLANVVGGQ